MYKVAAYLLVDCSNCYDGLLCMFHGKFLPQYLLAQVSLKQVLIKENIYGSDPKLL